MSRRTSSSRSHVVSAALKYAQTEVLDLSDVRRSSSKTADAIEEAHRGAWKSSVWMRGCNEDVCLFIIHAWLLPLAKAGEIDDVLNAVHSKLPSSVMREEMKTFVPYMFAIRPWRRREWSIFFQALTYEPSLYVDVPLYASRVADSMVDQVDQADRILQMSLHCIAHRMNIEKYPSFFDKGVNALLIHLSNYQSANGLTVLLRCLDRNPDYVVHAPALVCALEAMVPRGDAIMGPLMTAAGTTLIVRLVLQCRDVDDFLRAMPQHLTKTELAQLVALWPSRVCAALGRPVVPPDVTCTQECPIAQEPCTDPVIASDGFTYERDAILRWIVQSGTSPMTREPLDSLVVRNEAVCKPMRKRRRAEKKEWLTAEAAALA